MKKILLILIILLTLTLSGCKKEDYISVTASYIDYHIEMEHNIFKSNKKYIVELKYNNELYLCEWSSSTSNYENGDDIEVFLELCDIKE